MEKRLMMFLAGLFLIRQNEMYRFGKTKCDYFV